MVTASEDTIKSKRPSALYLSKPYTYRVKENPEPVPEGIIPRQTLTHVKIGGEPLVFDAVRSRLEMAGLDYDVYQWLELRHRIDTVFERAGLVERVSPPKGDWDSASSKFLTRNWRELVDQRVGTWKKPPWWLRWFYSAVISKESYGV